ncbi:hypothetical protein EDB92DRAFT_1817936 [Lactarius akahatsu]|uniref:Uncharacterized protein n=1 Tax=Lactarius akahatsu TaxID=416441 RepID=A0AAD4QBC4_9AGAM|nr:hypothetical protein EDB92DRAFT_1817936 [Lactarius akahatsu]
MNWKGAGRQFSEIVQCCQREWCQYTRRLELGRRDEKTLGKSGGRASGVRAAEPTTVFNQCRLEAHFNFYPGVLTIDPDQTRLAHFCAAHSLQYQPFAQGYGHGLQSSNARGPRRSAISGVESTVSGTVGEAVPQRYHGVSLILLTIGGAKMRAAAFPVSVSNGVDWYQASLNLALSNSYGSTPKDTQPQQASPTSRTQQIASQILHLP